MSLSFSEAASRYATVRDEVIRRGGPDVWPEIVELCGNVPDVIDLQSVWLCGRGKPCWSNIKVELGERIVDDLSLSIDFDDYHKIAGDDWNIKMLETGRKWKSNSNFEPIGKSVKKFLKQSSEKKGGLLASFVWRLYAIRQFAISLTREDGTLPMVREVIANKGRLPTSNVHAWATGFAMRAGMGWGATTVNHMLADLGLSVKPDLHLRRAVVRMGLLGPEYPSNMNADTIDEMASVLDPKAVSAVIDLSQHIAPTARPDASNALREMDKVLMEWSRLGMLRPL